MPVQQISVKLTLEHQIQIMFDIVVDEKSAVMLSLCSATDGFSEIIS